jgi:mycofactocin precursor
MRKSRSGLPPSSTVPPSNSRVEASSDKVKEPGSGVAARSGAGRNGEAIPGALSWAITQSWQSGVGDRLGRCPEEVGMLTAEDQDTQDVEELTDEDVDELLVEEVSIDGMCGVY